jgi:hypothetical protein
VAKRPGNTTKKTDAFLQAIGRAITDWAHIDEELFHICQCVLRADSKHVAIIYYRTPNLDARITLTDDLVKTILPARTRPNGGKDDPITTLWKELHADLKSALHIRNHLAHCPAAPMAEPKISPPGSGAFFIVDTYYASYTSSTEKLRGKAAKTPDTLKIEDVRDHIKSVSSYINRLRNFRLATLPTLL